jgi:YesN/AraC family two-component response regulator
MTLLPHDLERIQQVKIHIEKNHRQRITYASLAQQFHVSERKLSSDFKKLYKKSIYEYLTEVRIAKAKELLQQTFKPVKLIAYMIGYHESNLDKQFKKHTCMGPLEWRKRFSNYKPDDDKEMPDSP